MKKTTKKPPLVIYTSLFAGGKVLGTIPVPRGMGPIAFAQTVLPKLAADHEACDIHYALRVLTELEALIIAGLACHMPPESEPSATATPKLQRLEHMQTELELSVARIQTMALAYAKPTPEEQAAAKVRVSLGRVKRLSELQGGN